jgi:uncharacterized cupredoxin-like copper-binding protein
MARTINARTLVVLALGLLVAAAAVVLLSRGPDAGAAATQTLKLTADKNGNLKFNTTKLSAKAGKVTVVMTNPSSLTHAIGVSGHGLDKDGKPAAKGKTSTVTLTLKKGTYAFYCPIDGHRSAGMKGTIVVK